MDRRYLFENSLRHVKPYYHEYKTPYKQRWHHRSIQEILTRELGQNQNVVEHAIDQGHIYVSANNGKAGGPVLMRFSEARQRLLEPHDVIHNIQHMHEPCVLQEPILKSLDTTTSVDSARDGTLNGSVGGSLNGIVQKWRVVENTLVLYEDENILVVNKPAGVPTHPSGIFRRNSLTEIVRFELGVSVYPCHRLDKGTLGVLVLAKTKTGKMLQEVLQNKKSDVEKWYVARVRGKFPFASCTYTSPVFSINTAGTGYLNIPNAERVPANSSTHFKLALYSPELDESIVFCRPISGKMHQIRIHLRNMGYPISNDPLYNAENGLGHAKNQLEKELYAQVLAEWPCFGIDKTIRPPETVDVTPFLLNVKLLIEELASVRRSDDAKKIVSTCSECLRPIYQTKPDPGIYLHAWKMAYEGDVSFSFQTLYPVWIFGV